MKRVVAAALSISLLLGAGTLRAADLNYSGAYNGSMAGSMMSAMWDFMEWFLGRRNYGGYGPYNGAGPYARPPAQGAFSNPYRYRDYWDDPANPWVDMRSLDGVWLAQTGEYWYVRGNRFVLIDSNQQKSGGEFYVEGNFILTRMPGGEVEFEFRQMDDVLLLRDVTGRLMLLRRIEAGGWNW